MPVQTRIIYGVQQISFKDHSMAQTDVVLELSASGVAASGVTDFWEVSRGVQSATIGTTFDLEAVRQYGQIATYEQVENIPDLEITVERVLDGTHPLYLMASDSAFSELIGRSETYRIDIALNVYPNTQSRASGTIVSAVYASGMFLSDISYSFPVDGNFTESISFVGNNKFWFAASGDCGAAQGTVPLAALPSGVFDEDETANLQGALTGTLRRQDFDLNNSLFPSNIPGVDGANKLLGSCAECLQSVEISAGLSRDELFCLGAKDADDRFIELPVEVTTSITAHTRRGDLIEADASKDNLSEEPIKIVLSDGMTLDLGTKNKMTSVEVGDGDVSGSSLSITYNYTNENTLTITSTNYP